MRHYALVFQAIFVAILTSLIFVSVPLSGQDTWGLKEVITDSYQVAGHSPEQGVVPTLVDATATGGAVEVSMQFKQSATQNCLAKYRFEWQFSEPIGQLQTGQSFEVNSQAAVLTKPCRSAGAKMIVTDAAGVSPAFRAKGIRGFGGLSVPSRKWLQAEPTAATITTTVNVVKTSANYATLKLNFESTGLLGSERLHYEVVYLFEKGYQPEPKCDPDLVCHNLFSVGVLIGFAEYGASKDDNPQFLAEQLDGAVIHAEASKCVPTAPIKRLSTKLKSASSSRSLHSEISKMRDDLARYVEEHCNCCK